MPANELVGLGPGELFVHRNVANQVVGTDTSLMSILQFSLEFLEVNSLPSWDTSSRPVFILPL